MGHFFNIVFLLFFFEKILKFNLILKKPNPNIQTNTEYKKKKNMQFFFFLNTYF